ncbi:transposase [Mesorhizobium sp. M0145]
MEWDEPDASHQDRHEEGRYRRIEVITGRRRRRNWTPAGKARVVAESAESGANISAVARHWGVSRGLLSVWRRQAGLVQAKAAAETTPALQFVPRHGSGSRNGSNPGASPSHRSATARSG